VSEIRTPTGRSAAVLFFLWRRIDITCYGVDPPLAIFPGGHIVPLENYLAPTPEITAEIPRYKFLVNDLHLHYCDSFVYNVRTISVEGIRGFFK